MMWWTSLIPFALQALVIILDEWVFHVKRGLPAWERRGHPLDTLTGLLCMAFVIWIPFSKTTLGIYIFLAAFSCFFVTKDEFVHKEYCTANEQWLHSLLFTLHPITLITAGFIWPVTKNTEIALWIHTWLDQPQMLSHFLYGQFAAMSIFLFYQIVFWNVLWKDKPVLKPKSTMPSTMN